MVITFLRIYNAENSYFVLEKVIFISFCFTILINSCLYILLGACL